MVDSVVLLDIIVPTPVMQLMLLKTHPVMYCERESID